MELLNHLKKEEDLEMKELLEIEVDVIEKELSELETLILLSEEHDKFNAVFEIHSGAGGTEACDWANMLFRMYLRYFDRKNYKYEIIDETPGDEVGIKSTTIIVKGDYAFGYLKNEKGVHRLVRLSPFDSNNKRHTSFASVDVTPLFENNDIDIEIKEEDLKIDVYRSGGAGGQHVNTTDSAVRITHLPTKTVVTCQVERSQIKNRERALVLLKNKLYQHEVERRNEVVKNLKSSNAAINFGSQIRSYVMHPYSLVKDHRTDTENTNVNKVLDGDLDLFINSNLKRGN
jgi:peptide chain release factor 2